MLKDQRESVTLWIQKECPSPRLDYSTIIMKYWSWLKWLQLGLAPRDKIPETPQVKTLPFHVLHPLILSFTVLCK